MTKKICFVIYNRSNYARLKPILEKVKKSKSLKLQLILTSSSVLYKYGNLLEIIKKGLERSINCSSDPLCWESEGQGIFDLNLSACFSCSLVAETACEEMNLGLDRRVLVDNDFGFFKDAFV